MSGLINLFSYPAILEVFATGLSAYFVLGETVLLRMVKVRNEKHDKTKNSGIKRPVDADRDCDGTFGEMTGEEETTACEGFMFGASYGMLVRQGRCKS